MCEVALDLIQLIAHQLRSPATVAFLMNRVGQVGRSPRLGRVERSRLLEQREHTGHIVSRGRAVELSQRAGRVGHRKWEQPGKS